MDSLEEYFLKMKYAKMKIAVSLKNCSGLCFWYKIGFDKITKVRVEGEFLETAYGCLELERKLRR